MPARSMASDVLSGGMGELGKEAASSPGFSKLMGVADVADKKRWCRGSPATFPAVRYLACLLGSSVEAGVNEWVPLELRQRHS